MFDNQKGQVQRQDSILVLLLSVFFFSFSLHHFFVLVNVKSIIKFSIVDCKRKWHKHEVFDVRSNTFKL